jgi:hypothetical protein
MAGIKRPMYRRELVEDAFKALTPAASDVEIIATHAEYLLTRGPPPYVLRLDHDARKGPCPVWRDWKKDDLSGATFKDEWKARAWIIAAMALGHEVWRAGGRVNTAYGRGTLARIRASINGKAMHEAAKENAKRNGLPDPDDEIPF